MNLTVHLTMHLTGLLTTLLVGALFSLCSARPEGGNLRYASPPPVMESHPKLEATQSDTKPLVTVPAGDELAKRQPLGKYTIDLEILYNPNIREEYRPAPLAAIKIWKVPETKNRFLPEWKVENARAPAHVALTETAVGSIWLTERRPGMDHFMKSVGPSAPDGRTWHDWLKSPELMRVRTPDGGSRAMIESDLECFEYAKTVLRAIDPGLRDTYNTALTEMSNHRVWRLPLKDCMWWRETADVRAGPTREGGSTA